MLSVLIIRQVLYYPLSGAHTFMSQSFDKVRMLKELEEQKELLKFERNLLEARRRPFRYVKNFSFNGIFGPVFLQNNFTSYKIVGISPGSGISS